MYAVVDIAGQQVKVQEGDRVRVSHIDAAEGEKLTLDRVLLVSKDGETQVGDPQVDGAVVEASVIEHGKGDKIIIFKMKRRKGYRQRNGHRQPYTDLQINGIVPGNPS